MGHATVLVELAGARLLTDPFLTNGILHVRRRAPPPAVGDLRSLDAILISHAHLDHLDRRSLSLLAHEGRVIVPRGCGASVRDWGLREVSEVDEGDRLRSGEVVVEAVHAEHDGRRYPFGSRAAALGYLLYGSKTVYFAGDTGVSAEMSALAGRVDVALLPIWGWGPRIPADHLDPVRAAEAVALIRPRMAVPIHWGTLRAWGAQRHADPVAPPRAFADAVARVAPETEVRIVMPGQRTVL